jgi:hypothetical protein
MDFGMNDARYRSDRATGNRLQKCLDVLGLQNCPSHWPGFFFKLETVECHPTKTPSSTCARAKKKKMKEENDERRKRRRNPLKLTEKRNHAIEMETAKKKLPDLTMETRNGTPRLRKSKHAPRGM